VSNTDNVNIQYYVHTDWVWTDTNKRLTKERPDLSSERADSTGTALARPAATVNYRPVLSSERALQNNKPALVWRKCQGERKIGSGSRMGARYQDWLADWLSVVMWLRLRYSFDVLFYVVTPRSSRTHNSIIVWQCVRVGKKDIESREWRQLTTERLFLAQLVFPAIIACIAIREDCVLTQHH
jgi:hypothetical protein